MFVYTMFHFTLDFFFLVCCSLIRSLAPANSDREREYFHLKIDHPIFSVDDGTK